MLSLLIDSGGGSVNIFVKVFSKSFHMKHMKRNLVFLFSLAFIFQPMLGSSETVAFFYALDQDFQTLKTNCTPAGAPLKVGSRSVASLQLQTHRVYAVKMGSGAVETATSAQALLSRVRCDMAFSVGPVGALSDALPVGSWHIVTNVIAYQKGAWAPNGFQPASASPMISETNAAMLNLPAIFTTNAPITVASGEMFVASSNQRQQLHETTGADAVDMNLFGLTTVCADHRVPLFCWRIASDKADDKASEAFKKFAANYDGAGGAAVAGIIATLPANSNSPSAYPNLNKALGN
jgi:nucleoside phosphorylase